MKIIRPKAALFGNDGDTLLEVYGAIRLEQLGQLTELHPTKVTRLNIEQCLPELHDLEVIFSTWGMFSLSPEQLEQLPNLRAVFYAAGTVQHFAAPLLERGILVMSAWAANAVPVAEFTLGQILLANKGYFRNVGQYQNGSSEYSAFRGRGNYGAIVSVLGAGQIGRKLIELLRPFHLRVLVFDPFLSRENAAELGAEKVELDAAFARGNIVSNHLADLPQTRGLLNGVLLSSMPENATFINTGRGRTVHHAEMTAVLQSRPDLTALLDVTDPEPLPRDSPLWNLPNVHISGHIAGSIGDEVGRMADFVLEEFQRRQNGEPLRYAVSLQMLETMA